MLKTLLILLLILPLLASAQLKVSGRTVHYLTQKKLRLSQINVIDMASGSKFSVVLSNGQYKVKLERDKVYKLEYTKSGYYSKFVQVDTRGIPSNKSAVLYIEMDMVEDKLGIDQDFFNQAMGKCAYSPVLDQMEWDLEYSKMMFEKLNAEYERIGSSQKEDQTNSKTDIGGANVEMREEEPAVLEIANPFYLAEPIRQLVRVPSFTTRKQNAEFKALFAMGMHFAKLALDAEQDDMDSRIATLKMISNDVKPLIGNAAGDLNHFLIRLANNSSNQDSVDYIQHKIYLHIKDQLLIHNKEAFYIETGALIESIYHAVITYEKKSSNDLYVFIENSKNELYNYYLQFKTYGSQTDAALSLNAEISKLDKILKTIPPSTVGEKLQEDPSAKNSNFEIKPEILKTMKRQLEGIRSNFL